MARNRKAASVAEMVWGFMICIPIVLLLIDFTLMNLAQQINDSAAREADRLAASGDPSQAATRAQVVVNRINQSMAGYVSNVTLQNVIFNPTNLLTTEAALWITPPSGSTPGVSYGGVIQGYV